MGGKGGDRQVVKGCYRLTHYEDKKAGDLAGSHPSFYGSKIWDSEIQMMVPHVELALCWHLWEWVGTRAACVSEVTVEQRPLALSPQDEFIVRTHVDVIWPLKAQGWGHLSLLIPFLPPFSPLSDLLLLYYLYVPFSPLSDNWLLISLYVSIINN